MARVDLVALVQSGGEIEPIAGSDQYALTVVLSADDAAAVAALLDEHATIAGLQGRVDMWEALYRDLRKALDGAVDGRLVVGTMCHCVDHEEDPDYDVNESCDDHWEFFVDPVDFDPVDGTMSRARHLREQEMRAIAALFTPLVPAAIPEGE